MKFGRFFIIIVSFIMVRESKFKIESNGVKFEGNFRQAMNFIHTHQYDTSDYALNKRFGNIKECNDKRC